MNRISPSAIFLLAVVNLIGQTSDTSTIRGVVSDSAGGAISGVTVSVVSAESGFRRTVSSGAEGNYALEGLPVNRVYQVIASKPGFASASRTALVTSGGTTATLNLDLSPQGGRSEITVTGFAGELRTDNPQAGIDLSRRQIEAMPLLNRRITYLPLLNSANRPAINQGDVFMNQNLFTSNGTGRRQVWFEVDGVTGSDSWGRQTMFTNLPLAAVDEVQVLNNSFSAEYGTNAGTAVNIITKAGSNQWHGEALALARPAETSAALSGFTAATAANGNSLTGDRLYQGALTLAGPLSRAAHTQFLIAGEYSAEDRASPVTSPVAPGSFVGRYRGWLGSLRLDHQWNERNSGFLRSSTDLFSDTNPNGIVGGNTLPSVARVFRRRTYSEEAGGTTVLSPAVVNTLRLQFQLASPITQFDPVINSTQYSVPISTGGTFVAGTSQSAALSNRQYQAADTISAALGGHQLKFGASLIYARSGGNSKEFGGPIYLGQFNYKTCSAALTACESAAYLGDIRNVQSYTQSYGAANYTVNDQLWSAFVQDDVHLRPGLTVNLGLRYERQTFTDSTRNFAPRVGFAYDWGGQGLTVLRGGFGIYHSQIVDNAQANYTLSGPAGVFNYTASPGQVGFPATVASAPLAAFPSGAQPPVRSLYVRPGDAGYLNQFFDVSLLPSYPSQLLRPYTGQWTFGVQRKLARSWVFSLDYLGSHTIRINRALDVDAPASFIRTAPGQVRSAQAANCTRPYWIAWYAARNLACSSTGPQPPYSVIQTDVNNGYAYYQALNVNLSRSFSSKLSFLASYTWSHAIDNVDPDLPNQNPNDPNQAGHVENASAIFDQRQRLVVSGVYSAPFHIQLGGITTLGTGLPYNFVTGLNNSGDTGATADRPVINGVVVGRNTGRGRAIYELSPFVERTFPLAHEAAAITLRAESSNLLNHANFVGYSGTYGNGVAAGPGFGQPLTGVTNQLPARSFQFSIRASF